MSTQITCEYDVTSVGSVTVPHLENAISAAPIDSQFLQLYGLRVSSDVTSLPGGPGTNLITRVITMVMGPSAPATATAVLAPGDGTGSPIESVTVTGPGVDYVAPPIISFSTSAAAKPTVAAKAHALLDVRSVAVDGSGSLYSSTPTLTFSGGNLAPGGKQATATATVVGGHITAVTMVTNGGPYNTPPTITVTDSTGSGAILRARLEIASIVVDNPGVGYIPAAPPTVVMTPLFHAMCPDTTDQTAPVREFMTNIIQRAIFGPVTALAPVVT